MATPDASGSTWLQQTLRDIDASDLSSKAKWHRRQQALRVDRSAAGTRPQARILELEETLRTASDSSGVLFCKAVALQKQLAAEGRRDLVKEVKEIARFRNSFAGAHPERYRSTLSGLREHVARCSDIRPVSQQEVNLDDDETVSVSASGAIDESGTVSEDSKVESGSSQCGLLTPTFSFRTRLDHME